MANLKRPLTNSTSNLPLIRLSSINPFLLELSRRRANARDLLRDMNLPDDVPASGELFVSALAIYEFVERSADAANDPYFGYQIGQALELHEWEPITRAVEEAQTVGELLNRFIVYSHDHTSSTHFFLTTEGDRSTFGFRRVIDPPATPAQNDAFYLGFLGRLLMRATRDHWDPALVLFKVADPDAIPPLPDRLRIVRGDKHGMQASFPTDWLFNPFEKSAFHAETPNSGLTHLPESLTDSLRLALIPHLHEPDLTVERAAEICGYNKRKLSRKLREKGTTIAKEIAKLRAERAGKDLAHSDRRIADIALSLGFKDPTVFSRAFKNWTGQSPQEYRRNHRKSILEGERQ